jgi:hypothetical protein
MNELCSVIMCQVTKLSPSPPPFSLHFHALWKHTMNQVWHSNVIEGLKIWAGAAVHVHERFNMKCFRKECDHENCA